ncbi:maleylpyruvate isomerase family mycothiol-dependent enzyme [Ornithinimicrobium sp. INDO-MA30-4]|uniref:maleylpyruvate isomerase family mycothiol-dependent enzyme n=1 Tax=Ornithinimicrobium sp. INDO-MA30-4 TaxID=2908651 RepID=UPI001F3FEE4B|nr:maleylpyruvate isomerase family mycothiol-dependent enzyme [Ornithinimicrobium sp. INDO-MA30-4]UJH69596.1 maleylpyruvate isomerase family mycothiol-dependent enzyme [Ornithinimicrobium sp. INDO-MA30-4]
MKADDANLWQRIHEARRSLAADLATLTDEQWHEPTLCGDWDVEHVVAHLSTAASVGPWRWIASIVGSGFRPAVHNERRLQEQMGAMLHETLQRFEGLVNATVAPSGDTAAYLGEVLVHSEDIRHPLGLRDEGNVAAWAAVADFYASRDFAVPSKSRVKGLSLSATDSAFVSGEGDEVTGPTRALVMVMAGRSIFLEELSGPGASHLAERRT